MKTFNYNTTKIKNGSNWESIPALVGESAYQTAVRLGTFSGSEAEWNKQNTNAGTIATRLNDIVGYDNAAAHNAI